MKKQKTKSTLARFWVLTLILILLVAGALSPQRAQADHYEPGAGYIPEEGELLAGQFWQGGDTLNISIEMLTSGGTITYGLAWYGAKYTISLFFNTAVKPLEYWLNFIQTWREDTGLRVPLEFRPMTLMMLDGRLDIDWLAAQSYDLSVREGWDDIFRAPYAWVSEDVPLLDIEGGFRFIDNGTGGGIEPAPGPGMSTMSAARGLSIVPPSPMSIPLPPLGPDAFFTGVTGASKTKLFEFQVNLAGWFGRFEKTLGIPPRVTFVNLSYDSGAHGPDGVFIHKDGRVWLMEAKSGWRGSLGKTAGKVRQISPGWFQKAMLKVHAEDLDRFLAIRNKMPDGSEFQAVMDGVEHLAKNLDKAAKAISEHPDYVGENIDDIKAALKNFSEPDMYKKALSLSGFSDTEIQKFGKAWSEMFIPCVVNKKGLRPSDAADAERLWKKWIKAMGGTSAKTKKKILVTSIKNVFFKFF